MMGVSLKTLQSVGEFWMQDGSLLFALFFSITWIVIFAQQIGWSDSINSRLGKMGPWRGAAFASVGGLVTPFCSCSTVPVLSGMLRSDVRLATSFAFLISSPVINEGVIVLLLGKSGLIATAIYVLEAGILTTLAGVLVEAMGMICYLRPVEIQNVSSGSANLILDSGPMRLPLSVIFKVATRFAMKEIKHVSPYLLMGLGIGSLIYGFVPAEFLQGLTKIIPGPLLVVISALIGIPIYISPIAVVPVGFALIAKGFPIGPLIAFLIAAAGTSPPEMILLLRIFKWQLVATHVLVVFIASISLGFVLSVVWPWINTLKPLLGGG